MNNEFLSGFFEEAARSAPSLLVFKDLHRAFAVKDDGDQRPRIIGRSVPNVTVSEYLQPTAFSSQGRWGSK